MSNSVERDSHVNIKDSTVVKEMASEPYAFKLQKGAVSIKGKLEKDRRISHQINNQKLLERQKIEQMRS